MNTSKIILHIESIILTNRKVYDKMLKEIMIVYKQLYTSLYAG